MQDTVKVTMESIIAKSKLTKEARFEMTTNIKETITWTDYKELYKEARELGMADGKAQGMAEGKAEGKAEGIQEIARRLLKNNFSTDDISKYTGLTHEEVEKL